MDSDLASESMTMLKADLKLNFHISAITQAKGISQDVLGILFN
jgi:flagellin-like hook-associated protein FlgL